MIKRSLVFAGIVALFTSSAITHAQDISPNLATTVPSAFYTDRYTPTIFALANGVHGRNNVLQVQAGTDALSRPSGQQATFYNTQGMKTNVNTTGSWMFQSDLFVESNWITSLSASGYVRTDMWATSTDDVGFMNVTAYPIVGFTNYDGAARFRGYDVNTGGWIDFSSMVNFGAWNTLGMGWNSATNMFSYYVNGALAGSVLGTDPSTGVANVMYQNYNFNDPSLGIMDDQNDVVNYSNTAVVPEPSAIALMTAGLAALGMVARRRKQRAA